MAPKSILVTGCSAGGIGAAIALDLAKTGNNVFATARVTSKIPTELSSLSNITIIQLDVVSRSSVAAAAKKVTESGFGLDGLVNNAGAGYGMPILDLDVDKARQLHDTNVWGPVRCIQAFAQLLIESRGRIVNISTVGAIISMPWISTYTSSKAALTNISECLRHELAPFGVTVVTIMGGIVESNFSNNDSKTKLPGGSLYAPIEDVIDGWTSGRSKPKGMSTTDFAAHVASDIVGTGNGTGGLVWKGPNAGSINFATRWFPTSMMDSAMTKYQGLDKLAAERSK